MKMPAYVRTPEIPGVPVRQVTVAVYRRKVKTEMPYVWRPWEGSVALFDRDGGMIAGVKREERDRFFTSLLALGDSKPLELGATGGVVVRVEPDDFVPFVMSFAKVGLGFSVD
jgi:hypothetical protein